MCLYKQYNLLSKQLEKEGSTNFDRVAENLLVKSAMEQVDQENRDPRQTPDKSSSSRSFQSAGKIAKP